MEQLNLEEEIINILSLMPDLFLTVDSKYFSGDYKEIVEYGQKKVKDGNFDYVDFVIYCHHKKIYPENSVYTLREFESLYQELKEKYNSQKLQIAVQKEVLPFLESSNYEDAIINLHKILSESELTDNEYIQNSKKIIKKIEGLNKSESDIFYSKIPSLDNMLKGFKKKQYCIIAGRPHMGKTTFALWLAYEFIKQNKKILYFAFEQPAEILFKILASFYYKKKFYELNMQEIKEFADKFQNIYFIDKGMNIFDIIYQIKIAKIKYNIDCVIVDYIGLIKSHVKLRKNELISEISKELKNTAMDDLLVITLAQINREAENRFNKRPTLGTLKDSGALEEDADVVLLLYRDYYYNRKADKDKMEIILAKNRGIGITGIVETKMIEQNIREIEQVVEETEQEIEENELPF